MSINQNLNQKFSRNLNRNLSRIGFIVILSCLLVGCNTAQDTASLEPSPEIQSLTDSINVALGENDYYGASQIVERFVTNHPDAFAAWEIRGRIYRDANQYEKARQSFETAAQLRPGDIGVWHELGNIAVTEQRYQDAVTAFRHAASDGSGPLPWHGLGRAYMEIGDFDSSRVALQMAIEADSLYAGSHAAMSELFEREGNIDESIRSMWRAQTLAPTSPVFRSELGRLLVIGNRAPEAMVWLEPLLDKPPVRSQTLFALSRALQQLGRDEEASHFAKQFEIVSEREAAVFRFEERVRLTPSSMPDRLALADAYRQLGEFDKALRHALIVEGMSEPNAALQHNIGTLFLAAGDSVEAAARFARAAELE